MLAVLLMACAKDADSDTAEDPDLPTETVDVLVIGSGPAGLAAANMASGAGKTVRILEKESMPGGSGWYAGRYFGVGTRFQQLIGVNDTAEAALADWPRLSGGGEVDDHVRQLVQRSKDVIEWLVGDLGSEVSNVGTEPGQDPVPRMHDIGAEEEGPVQVLVDRLNDRLTLDTVGTEIVFEDGRAVGCRYEGTLTGETGWIAADAVVVASGGFARNLEKVLEDRPEFADVPYLVEMGFPADGGGIPLLAGAGAQWQNRGAMGFYAHSIVDPDRPGETLWPLGIQYGVFVDLTGHRVADEESMTGFLLVDTLLASPEQRLLAVIPEVELDPELTVPRYNVGEGDAESVSVQSLVDRGVIREFSDVHAMAVGLGIDPDTVDATFARYESLAIAGDDADFHKSASALRPFGTQHVYVLELRPGAAKSFSGFAVDLQGHVTDAAGQPIPGLYAAGEAVGMLGSPGAGRGFSGSITAVYLTGIIAGENAVADNP